MDFNRRYIEYDGSLTGAPRESMPDPDPGSPVDIMLRTAIDSFESKYQVISGHSAPSAQEASAPSLGDAARVLYDEDFDRSGLTSGSWKSTAPSTSVTISNGMLHIASDNHYDDGADNYVNIVLPAVVETRMKLASGGRNYTVPALGIFYGPTENEADFTTYLPNISSGDRFGWKFMDEWTNVHTMGPQSENQWVTIRVVLQKDGGELSARADGDVAFTPIVKRTWSLPANIVRLTFRQPWDAVCDIDYIRITKCRDL